MTLYDKLFSFKGRLRRSDWWILGIAIGLLGVLLEFAADRLLFPGQTNLDEAVLGDPVPVVLASLALIALTFWPTAALYAKRAHDLNWPAWPIIASLFAVVALPYLPYDLAPAFSEGPVTGLDVLVTTLTCLLMLGWIVMVFVLAFIDGSPGPNRFGPSPKGLPGGAPAFMAPGGLG